MNIKLARLSREELVKLGHEKPELRQHIRPLLKRASVGTFVKEIKKAARALDEDEPDYPNLLALLEAISVYAKRGLVDNNLALLINKAAAAVEDNKFMMEGEEE